MGFSLNQAAFELVFRIDKWNSNCYRLLHNGNAYDTGSSPKLVRFNETNMPAFYSEFGVNNKKQASGPVEQPAAVESEVDDPVQMLMSVCEFRTHTTCLEPKD